MPWPPRAGAIVAEPAGVATVRELGSALASQRGALESGQLHDLDRIIAEVSAAMDRVQAFPGGVAGLREAIEALPEPVRASVDPRRALADRGRLLAHLRDERLDRIRRGRHHGRSGKNPAGETLRHQEQRLPRRFGCPDRFQENAVIRILSSPQKGRPHGPPLFAL